ncbi:hypothetical protein D3C85_1178410 [compost metagenome]
MLQEGRLRMALQLFGQDLARLIGQALALQHQDLQGNRFQVAWVQHRAALQGRQCLGVVAAMQVQTRQ